MMTQFPVAPHFGMVDFKKFQHGGGMAFTSGDDVLITIVRN